MYIKKADRVTVERPMPPLPTGVVVADKTPEVEMLRRSNSKWIIFANAVDCLPPTKVLKVDVKGCNKGRINTIRQGIKGAWKNLGLKRELKFSVDANMGVLNVWTN